MLELIDDALQRKEGTANTIADHLVTVQEWISVSEGLPQNFVSVLGYMTDAGEFPPVRECYTVGNAFFFPVVTLVRDTKTAERRMIMNRTHSRNNIYKNGEYNIHFADRLKAAQSKIIPTMSQIEYRNALYQFSLQKGVIQEGFPLGRTRSQISSNIRAFITILRKNGLDKEFFETHEPKAE